MATQQTYTLELPTEADVTLISTYPIAKWYAYEADKTSLITSGTSPLSLEYDLENYAGRSARFGERIMYL